MGLHVKKVTRLLDLPKLLAWVIHQIGGALVHILLGMCEPQGTCNQMHQDVERELFSKLISHFHEFLDCLITLHIVCKMGYLHQLNSVDGRIYH